jgi:hypothetical protein
VTTPQLSYDKIVNPALARLAFHANEAFGEFKVIVRFAKPKYPPYLKVIGPHSPGHIKARVPCNQIARMSQDNNVLSIELREHVTK